MIKIEFDVKKGLKVHSEGTDNKETFNEYMLLITEILPDVVANSVDNPKENFAKAKKDLYKLIIDAIKMNLKDKTEFSYLIHNLKK